MRRRTHELVPALGAFIRCRGANSRNLAQALRAAIAAGELKAGDRLPSSRTLAGSLGFARGTVVEAYDQLKAEGWLEARTGAGTRVGIGLDAMPQPRPSGQPVEPEILAPTLPIQAGKYAAVAAILAPPPSVPFAISVPEGAVAPDVHWRRVGARVRSTAAAQPGGYGDPMGVLELRQAVAEYLRSSRAVFCTAAQIVITAGTQQGLSMASRILLERGDTVWAEDPGYPGMIGVLEEAGAALCRVPVDREGFDLNWALREAPDARAAFLTPSHQYPVGMPLSMTRRQGLVRWAQTQGRWIVEDDYDSELRYSGHPFPAMQGLAPQHTIYLGTFSKVLFPSLRLGYAVVPEPLVDAFAGARFLMDRHSPVAEQHVLAAYIREGHFQAHLRRIRIAYGERHSALVDALQRELPSWATLEPSDQGMHVVVWLPPEVRDTTVAIAAAADGLAVRAISPMCARAKCNAVMLGFGGFSPEQLQRSVSQFASLLHHLPAECPAGT
ncbi:PLP-dependent aminotransferase family protein [Xanthomonas arboricola]|uniref:MocR-like pyridoxine biosynthesis transcription factor PdxR n=1 Tax=Xanthomonas arboricola TaxID=56448 RepID=UPI00068CA936|nr:PLP-dependent aminotransferase family protein [Xanthomonas arboricola]